MTLSLEEIQDAINELILATPTGDRRNHLCDANLHLICAIEGRSYPQL